MAYELTDAGLVVSTAAEMRDEIKTALEDALGRAVDFDSDIALATVITIFAGRLAELGGALRQVYAARDLNNAQGVQLDALGELLDLDRALAQRAFFEAELEGTPGVIVPFGARIRLEDGSNRVFALAEGHEIGSGNPVRIVAEVAGAVSLSSASTFSILDAQTGWTGVPAPTAIFRGTDEEGDASYRRRIKESGVPGVTANSEAMLSAVQLVPGVRNVGVVNNPSSTTLALVNLSVAASAPPNIQELEPHSFGVIVYPALDDANAQTLAEVIYRVQPAGILASGNDLPEALLTNDPSVGGVAQITGSDDIVRVVRWVYAQPLLCKVDVDVNVDSTRAADTASSIQQAIVEFFRDRQPGDPVYFSSLASLLNDIPGVINPNTIQVEVTDSDNNGLGTFLVDFDAGTLNNGGTRTDAWQIPQLANEQLGVTVTLVPV